MNRDIKLLKNAIKKGEEDPFLYTNEELHKLKSKLRQLRYWKRSATI